MDANHEHFSFNLGVTNFNKKTSPSDELGKKSLFRNDTCVLKVETLSKETGYIMAMEVFVAFGRVEQIKILWQAHNKTNTFYFFFANAESAALTQSKINNKKEVLEMLNPFFDQMTNLTQQ